MKCEPAATMPRLPWNPDAVRRHPGLAPVAELFGVQTAAAWPSRATLEALLSDRGVANAAGMPLTLVDATGGTAADYERRIGQSGHLSIRPEQWHDLFNVCMWALWPATKAALNRGHCNALAVQDGPRRSPLRDALTAIDEDGIVIAVTDPALADLACGFRWRELFIDRRADLAADFQPFVIGHGLCEKLLAPFVGLTAKALLVPVEAHFAKLSMAARAAVLDAAVAGLLIRPGGIATPADLAPLPVLGLPGWWPGNDDPGFYDAAAYFRSGRRTECRVDA